MNMKNKKFPHPLAHVANLHSFEPLIIPLLGSVWLVKEDNTEKNAVTVTLVANMKTKNPDLITVVFNDSDYDVHSLSLQEWHATMEPCQPKPYSYKVELVTKWFLHTELPTYEGWYERLDGSGIVHRSYYHEGFWYYLNKNGDYTIFDDVRMSLSNNEWPWRGLAQEPK